MAVMEIKVTKRGSLWAADWTQLPGSPPLGFGKTKEEAVANLFVSVILNDPRAKAHLVRVEMGKPVKMIVEE